MDRRLRTSVSVTVMYETHHQNVKSCCMVSHASEPQLILLRKTHPPVGENVNQEWRGWILVALGVCDVKVLNGCIRVVT